MAKNMFQRMFGEPPPLTVEDVGDRKAAELYKMWHEKKPDGVYAMEYDFPKRLVVIGKAVSIIYASDKWEKDGDTHRYIHKFDSRPNVYGPTDSHFGARSNPSVSTSEILRDNPDGQVALPMIAAVEKFVYVDPSGEECVLDFRPERPLMCMTKDARGLVIFAEFEGVAFPLFVRGGEMYVNSHGIIK